MDVITWSAAAFALTAGVLAAFNPCGFAILPAYLTLIVTGSAEEGVSRIGALRRAVAFSLTMTLGFVAVFSGFGILFATAQSGLQGDILPYLAYVTIVLGVLLVWLGIRVALGGDVGVPGLRVQGVAPVSGWGSQVGYGATFALASMSCTIGPFLAIVTGALDSTNPLGAFLPFVIYGIGMGTSVLTVSLVAAVAGSTVVARIRKRTPAIMRAAGILMIVAGAYVLVFGLAEVLPKFGIRSLDGFLRQTSKWQGDVTRVINDWGAPVLVGFAIAAALVATWLLLRYRARAARPATPQVDAD